MAGEGKKGGGLRSFMEAQATPPAPPEARRPAAAAADVARPRGTTPKKKKEKRRLKDGREQLVIYLRPSRILALKRLKIDLDTPVTEIVASAVDAELRRHGIDLPDDDEDKG